MQDTLIFHYPYTNGKQSSNISMLDFLFEDFSDCVFRSLKRRRDRLESLAYQELVQKLNAVEINVLFTGQLTWPRDELHVSNTGEFIIVEKLDESKRSHFANEGGTLLVGNNFAFYSESAHDSKLVLKTEHILGKPLFSLNIISELGEFNHISVSGNRNFFKPSFPHLDLFFNIDNIQNRIFTYDAKSLILKANQICNVVNYSYELLPQSEMCYAAVGFTIINNVVVIDSRAKKSIEKLSGLGYQVIPTPKYFPITRINRNYGSLHCKTYELPITYSSLRFVSTVNYNNYQRELFMTPFNQFVECDHNRIKLNSKT